MHCYVYRRDESIGKDASIVFRWNRQESLVIASCYEKQLPEPVYPGDGVSGEGRGRYSERCITIRFNEAEYQLWIRVKQKLPGMGQ